jgi:membrane fusion protein, multidrug efflux system
MSKAIWILLLCSMILIGCAEKAKPKPPQHHVDVRVVRTNDVPYELDYPGTVVGVADFPVVARVGGALFKQLYTEGTFVKKGQPLYLIDQRPFENQLKADKGQLLKDTAAMIQYKSILDRYDRLFKINAVSKQDIEMATINYKAALGQVETDKANIAQDKLNIKYCLVEAPVDGLIAQRVVTIGQMVSAFQTVLNYINSKNNMYISFSIPENDRLALEKGVATGKVTVPKGYKFNMNLQLADSSMLNKAGLVNFHDTRISLQNGTWSMRGDINNIKLETKLLAGQFLHVYLTGAIFKNAIAIPQVAVFRDNKGAFVYIINKNKVAKRQVEAGMMSGSLWVIESGLMDGDQVIIDGGMKVKDGDTVVVDNISDQGKLPIGTIH